MASLNVMTIRYLSPGLIALSIRFRAHVSGPGRYDARRALVSPGHKKELTEWRDVIAALELEHGEAARISLELWKFGAQMNELGSHMKQAGVDEDIIAFLRPNVEEQIRQLRSIGDAK